MFEQEAEEIEKEAIKWVKDVFPNDEFKQSGISRALVEFAEFGYNKANEWRFVKDGLPKTSGRYLVYTGGEPFILDFDTEVNSFGYWVVSLGDDWGVQDEDFETVKDRGEDDVIAWKEIVLPKEIKEKCLD